MAKTSPFRAAFASKRPDLYLLKNGSKKGWVRFGFVYPSAARTYSVAASTVQASGARNLLPDTYWYPVRIAQIKSDGISRKKLQAVEETIREKLNAEGFRHPVESNTRNNCFKAKVGYVWKLIASELKKKKIKFESVKLE